MQNVKMKLETKPLFKLLEKKSQYFTSLAFFGALLTVTLFIKSDNPNLVEIIPLLQSASLMLFILCLFPMVKEIEENQDLLITSFGILIFMVMIGLIGYLWHEYNKVIINLTAILLFILGVINFLKIKEIVEKKNKFWKICKKQWYWTLPFLIITTFHVILIIKGQWWNFFTNQDLNLLGDIVNLVFAGYLFGLFLLLIAASLVLLSKLKECLIVK